MLRTALALSLASSLLVLDASAQNGRTLRLLAPAVLGQTASVDMLYSPTLAGSVYCILMSTPRYAAATPITVPGLINSIVRIDPNAYTIPAAGVMTASGQTPPFSFSVPFNAALAGFTFDLQGLDIQPNSFLTLTDNDLEFTVALPPQQAFMQLIQPGTFQMGSTVFPTENVHTVTISRPYWIGRYEVSQAQFQAVMGYNPSGYGNTIGAQSRAAEGMTFAQAVSYCQALSVMEAAFGRVPTGYEYRLPTEAEWEYACRAGTTTEYNFGSTIDCSLANFATQPYLCVGQTNYVGMYPPNAWGLYDMHGNVSEWCLDNWDLLSGYDSAPATDPLSTVGSWKVVRGGAWSSIDIYSRSASRGVLPGSFSYGCGIRVVLAPVLP